jgi:serine/threonine protein kinase
MCKLRPGLRIQDFELVRPLGQGGEAVVWQIRELAIPRRDDIAAKLVVIPFDDRATPAHADRLRKLQEVELANLAKLGVSQSIIPFYTPVDDIIEDGGVRFIVIGVRMPLADGDLSKELDGTAHLLRLITKRQLKTFFLRLARGLKVAHDLNVCHGDIKPENILLFRDGEDVVPKFIDFGLSLSAPLSMNRGAGTPEYMAPEAFKRGESQSIDVAKACDVYSLGVVFYLMYYQRLPYIAEWTTEEERFERYRDLHTTGELPKPKTSRVYDSDLPTLIIRMLAKDGTRPLLHEVVRTLDAQLSVSPRRADIPDVLRADTYRWNPQVHQMLGNQLQYYLFKASHSLSDIDWITNNLRDQGIHGYAVYRVLGGYDYLLRIWIKPDYEERVLRLMEHFRQWRATPHQAFVVRQIELFEKTRSLKYTDRDSLLQAIAQCADPADEDSEFGMLKTAGFVSSRLPRRPATRVRFFLTVTSPQTIPDKVFDMFLARTRTELLTKNVRPSEISMYYGKGDIRGIIKFRLAHFHDYALVTDALQKYASDTRVTADLGFQTFVEPDPQGFRESDDGSIVREASEYSEEH